MQSQFFMLKQKELKTGKMKEIPVQGALRPTIFGAYEYIFPKEALPEVLSMMGIDIDKEFGQIEINLKNKFRMFSLRKIFGCKRIPKKYLIKAKETPNAIKLPGFTRMLPNCILNNVIIHCIGIKEDEIKKVPEWGIEQEML